MESVCTFSSLEALVHPSATFTLHAKKITSGVHLLGSTR